MDSNSNRTNKQVEKQKKALQGNDGSISLTSIMESDRFQEVITECREFRDRIYTPLVTLLIFIKQVLNPDKSCKRAVAGFVVEQLSGKNKESPSTNTGPYCLARKRLPEKCVHDLVKISGQSMLAQASDKWKIYGRDVKAIDGTTVKMADSKANQNEYPQHGKQAEGAGFPIARLVAVMSLTLGTVVNYAIGAYKGKGTGEQSLFKSISGCIEKDDIVLVDRYYPSYFFIADMKQTRADVIGRAQGQRHYDFRKGIKLGKNDHIITWVKPNRPKWMSQSEYDCYPEEIDVREFKVSGEVYVTTFVNQKLHNKKELAKVYRLRWHIEINLNCIKTTMNMDMLTCKTPEMVRKEIGVHFLAYNMVRIVMAEACEKHEASPRHVSFKGSIQLLNEFMPHFLNSSAEKSERLYFQMLKLITKNKIGNRPGRVEPRLIKQRRKPFKTLKRPRNIEKDRLLKRAERRNRKYPSA